MTLVKDWKDRWRHTCPQEEDDTITIVFRSPDEHFEPEPAPAVWMMNPEDDHYRAGPISFCPWCGVKLPEPNP